MKHDDVRAMLALFVAAWPNFDPGEAAVAVWSEAVADVKPAVARAATRRLTKSEERPPTPARFLAECRKLERDELPQLAPGAIVGATTRAQAAVVIRAIRHGMAVAARDVPEHRHHDKFGGDRCPACSTRHIRDAAPEVLAAIREHLAGVPVSLGSEEDRP